MKLATSQVRIFLDKRYMYFTFYMFPLQRINFPAEWILFAFGLSLRKQKSIFFGCLWYYCRKKSKTVNTMVKLELNYTSGVILISVHVYKLTKYCGKIFFFLLKMPWCTISVMLIVSKQLEKEGSRLMSIDCPFYIRHKKMKCCIAIRLDLTLSTDYFMLWMSDVD